MQIREGLHYNPYFPGGAIAMPKMLNDGAVEYEDGTPATEAQMGKDIVSFLSWAAEPEMEKETDGIQVDLCTITALLQAAYYRRLRWSVLKSRKLVLMLSTRISVGQRFLTRLKMRNNYLLYGKSVFFGSFCNLKEARNKGVILKSFSSCNICNQSRHHWLLFIISKQNLLRYI
ncbi:putative cytochrome c1, cytochrome c-like domain superfamily [Helianthus annuus]|nr:putative cytochrome c1, cytochrome c-like domain superfamily [Helianthus annuus]